MIIVSDAGPLIALAKTGNLNILKQLFGKVKIPPQVFIELETNSSKPGAINLKAAIGAAVLLAMLVTVILGLWPASLTNLVAQIPLG